MTRKKPSIIVDWQTVGVGRRGFGHRLLSRHSNGPGNAQGRGAWPVSSYQQGLARGVPEADLAGQWDTYRGSSFAGMMMGVTASMVVVQTDRGDSMFLAMAERSAHMVLDHAEVALSF